MDNGVYQTVGRGGGGGGGASEVIKRGLVVENISAILNSCFFYGGWGVGGGRGHLISKLGVGSFGPTIVLFCS